MTSEMVEKQGEIQDVLFRLAVAITINVLLGW
jgi:hypothetical protein